MPEALPQNLAQIGGQTTAQTTAQATGQPGGQMDSQMDSQMDRQISGQPLDPAMGPATGPAAPQETRSLTCPRWSAGVVTAAQLEALALAIRQYEIPLAKLVSGQRMHLAGIKAQDLPGVRACLGMNEAAPEGRGALMVQACPGLAACRFAHQDSLGLGARLEALCQDLALPGKLKAGVSACPRCCAESLVRDIGLVGSKNGWSVVFGGNAGAKPRVGDVLAAGLDADAALALVGRVLAYYARHAKPRQRTARFAEGRGIASLRQALGLEGTRSGDGGLVCRGQGG